MQSLSTVVRRQLATRGLAIVMASAVAACGGDASTIAADPVDPTPSPRLDDISPNTNVAGGDGFLLGVRGTNFGPRSVVQWNGQPQRSYYIDYGAFETLRADIPNEYLRVAGSAAITVRNVATGQTSNVATFTIYVRPVVIADPRFTSIASGDEHVCGLLNTGAVACWGRNSRGQLGIATFDGQSSASPIVGDLAFRSLTSGSRHSCALTVSGAAYCWGDNSSGQLGDGTVTDRAAPTPVVGSMTFTSIAAGRNATCGSTSAGVIMCWGSSYGRTPSTVPSSVALTSLAVGDESYCGVDRQRTIMCWGYNGVGEFGDGTTAARPSPGPVAGNFTWNQVAMGWGLTCGLTTNGLAHCWGYFTRGSGLPGPIQPVPGGRVFSSIMVAGYHACGLDAVGQAFCWRSVIEGSTPIAAAGTRRFVSMSGGGDHNCGLLATGQVYCWNSNTTGAIAGGPPNAPPVP